MCVYLTSVIVPLCFGHVSDRSATCRPGPPSIPEPVEPTRDYLAMFLQNFGLGWLICFGWRTQTSTPRANPDITFFSRGRLGGKIFVLN